MAENIYRFPVLQIPLILLLLSLFDATRFSRQRRDVSFLNETLENTNRKNETQLKSRSSILASQFKEAMAGYDRRFRPNFGGKPHEIELEIHVLSFSDINEAEMEYSADMYFAQLWYDPRLIIANANENDSMVLIGGDVDSLWLPDTIFVNSKRASTHKVTRDNRMITIYFQTGHCIFHSRITLWVACSMNLRRYPFDTQGCNLAIESYGHDDLDLVYKWRIDDQCVSNCTKIYVYDNMMSKFDLAEAKKSSKRTKYHTDNFSWATAHFRFRRRSQYFITRVYAPCVLIVVVSFTTFWISQEAVPARAAICITSILTLITMLGVVNANMPEVSYMKSLDIYLLVSFVFVFCALLEYIAVLNTNLFKSRDSLTNTMHHNRQQKRGCKKPHTHANGTDERVLLGNDVNGLFKRHAQTRTFSKIPLDNYEMVLGSYQMQETKVSRIDLISRIVFPLSYATLNIAYWVVSLGYSDEPS